MVLLGFVGTACDPQLSRKASGTFTGTQFFDGVGCPSIHQVFDATYVRERGQPGGTFHLDGCVTFDFEGGIKFEGSFVLTNHGGATLTGTVAGEIASGLDLTLAVVEGTKRFQGTTGSIELDGNWDGGGDESIDGTLSAILQDDNGERIAL